LNTTKTKHAEDEHGFIYFPEEGERYDEKEKIALDPKILIDLINKSTTVMGKFKISSGKIILCTLGNPEYAFRIMMNFPKGDFDAYIIKEGKDADYIIIPFLDFKISMLRFHVYIEKLSVPKGIQIDSMSKETLGLQVQGRQLFLIDEAEWSKNRDIIYPDSKIVYNDTIKTLNSKEPGKTLVLPFDDQKNSKLSDTNETKRFYFAYAGYTLDGDPAFLWLSKRKGENIK
jgi:hypothetical protein